MPRRHTIVCTYFLRDACTQGDRCTFSHQASVGTSPASATQSVCAHFVRGTCRYGQSCRQLHSKEKSALGDVPVTRGKSSPAATWRKSSISASSRGPCLFFRRGECTKGDACPFEHSHAENSPSTPPAESAYSTGLDRGSSEATPLAKAAFGPCKYFEQGRCAKGDECSFPHISIAKPQVLLEKVTKEVLSEQDSKRPVTFEGDKKTSEQSTERTINHCKVHFGSGASVLQITTPFESRRLILSALPAPITQADLIPILEPFGELSNILIERSSAFVGPTARVEFATCNEASGAVQSLHNKECWFGRLEARLDLRAVESGTATVLSRKAKISWYAPTIIVWAHYDTIAMAKRHAERLNGKMFSGCKISASFQTPGPRQTTSFSVDLKGLPLKLRKDDLNAFCQSNSITVGRPSYDLDARIHDLRRRLLEFGPLDAFDILPTDKKKPKVTTFVQFSSSDAVAAAVKALHGVKQGIFNGSPLWVEQIHSVKYNVPARQFMSIRVGVDQFEEREDTQCKVRYYEWDEHGRAADPVCIRVFAAEAKALGRVKQELEKLIGGHHLVVDGKEVWDEYFETTEGELFVEELNSSAFSFVKCDKRARSVRMYGNDASRRAVEETILSHLEEVRARRHIIPVHRDALRALLNGGLKDLHDAIGAEKVSLDVVARTITVRGNEADVQRARKAVAATRSLFVPIKSANDDEFCPVCFCEVVDPVELPCGHPYCTNCLQHLLRSAAGSNFSVLRCVADVESAAPCKTDIPYQTIRDLLSSSEEKALLEASFLSHVHERPLDFRYCPTPDCQVMYRPGTSGTVLNCPSCLVRICASCNVEFHEGLTCEEHRQNLSGGVEAYERWKAENGIKSCPTCKADLEKNGGCNHIECIRCRTHMCWVCLATFTDLDSGGGVYAHMREKHGGIGI